MAAYTTVSPSGGTGATWHVRQYSHYCYSTFIWDSFFFIASKHSHCFEIGVWRKEFCHERTIRLSVLPDDCWSRKSEICFLL